jgi:periplasmic protein CpxP/Spy
MKNRILYGSIVLLFAVNCFQIYWQFKHVPEHPPKPREIIIEKLRFSENQIKAYDKLITQHQRDIRILEEELHTLKGHLYKKILVQNDVLLDVDFQEISDGYERIERINIAHFLEIKKICSKEQVVMFENIVPELAKMFKKPPRRRANINGPH